MEFVGEKRNACVTNSSDRNAQQDKQDLNVDHQDQTADLVHVLIHVEKLQAVAASR